MLRKHITAMCRFLSSPRSDNIKTLQYTFGGTSVVLSDVLFRTDDGKWRDRSLGEVDTTKIEDKSRKYVLDRFGLVGSFIIDPTKDPMTKEEFTNVMKIWSLGIKDSQLRRDAVMVNLQEDGVYRIHEAYCIGDEKHIDVWFKKIVGDKPSISQSVPKYFHKEKREEIWG